jgi:hypothetical protein
MTAHAVSRAPTGARVAGDDFQFLVTATAALRALHDPRGLVRFAMEARDEEPLDDLVIRFSRPPHEHTQIKFCVDASTPLRCADLRAAGRSGRSTLQRIYERWSTLRERDLNPGLVLLTARQIDPTDPVLCQRNTQTELLVPQALLATATAAIEEWGIWEEHLGIDREMLRSFLTSFAIRTGYSERAVRELLVARLFAHGLRSDDEAVALVVSGVRNWVKGPRPSFDRAELAAAIDDLSVGAQRSAIHVSLSVIDKDPKAAAATHAVDVTDIYGSEIPAFERRRPADARAWADRVGPAFEAVRQQVVDSGERRLFVTGAMRLACWFLAGASFRDATGFTVFCRQPQQEWDSSSETGAPEELDEQLTAFDRGQSDIAVALSITHPIAAEVEAYVRTEVPSVEWVASLSVRQPGKDAVRDGSHALALALTIQRQIQRLIARTSAQSLHVFLGCPAGLALFVGHRWNRLRPTTVYEDAGAGRGYFPTFHVAA